jgi:polysaccharide biosynthesis protein PslJ
VSDRVAVLGGTPGAAPGGANPKRAELTLWLFIVLAVVLVAAAYALQIQPTPILGAVALSLVLVSYQRTLLAWPTLLGAVILVILFIPLRRYTVGGGLPIELEPYRIVIAVVLACWLLAICADPSVRWRRTGFEAPIITLLVAIVLSLALNIPRVNEVSGLVVKQVTFFLSYFLLTYFISSVIRKGMQLDRMLRVLVAGGTIVAILSLIEWSTGTNYFDSLHKVIPILHHVDLGEHIERGTGVRALGSAQHSIALGAALVMLIPLTVYLHRREEQVGWLACGALLTLGALATGSRTAALMLISLGVSFLWIKRTETLRLLPLLIPLFIVIQVVMPGTLGTFKAILQPSYVIEEQSQEMGTGSGRIADLGPSLEEWAQTPLLGQGFGTRVTSQQGATDAEAIAPDQTAAGGAQILDDQWLGALLEIGAVGVLALLWLFWRPIRRLARLARSDPGPDGWLAVGLAASLTAFAVGMFTFDAFAFIQVTFFAFIMIGFSAVVLRRDRAW